MRTFITNLFKEKKKGAEHFIASRIKIQSCTIDGCVWISEGTGFKAIKHKDIKTNDRVNICFCNYAYKSIKFRFKLVTRNNFIRFIENGSLTFDIKKDYSFYPVAPDETIIPEHDDYSIESGVWKKNYEYLEVFIGTTDEKRYLCKIEN